MNIVMGPGGAVDLDEIDCFGCKHKSKQVCKLNPPVWASANPVYDKKGQLQGMTPGGWSFPPAIRKCGQFTKPEES